MSWIPQSMAQTSAPADSTKSSVTEPSEPYVNPAVQRQQALKAAMAEKAERLRAKQIMPGAQETLKPEPHHIAAKRLDHETKRIQQRKIEMMVRACSSQ